MKAKMPRKGRPKAPCEPEDLDDDLVRNLTHDLKSPLSVILADIMLVRQTYPSILQPGRNTATFISLLDSMERNALRIRSTIENVLEADLLDAKSIRKEKVDVGEIASKIISNFTPVTEPKGLTLESHIGPSLHISGDPGMILYVLTVLMSNAVKFTVKGTVAISAQSSGKYVAITVSDTGSGISKSDQEHIFEKHFKADPSAPGTGQGLHIAKQIVEGHGGSISFTSSRGKGTSFVVLLPKSAK